MILDFDKIAPGVFPSFKGGEKKMTASMFFDGQVRVMRAQLEPGASIGLHTHEDNSEVIYLLRGSGKVLMDDSVERLLPGQAHYCPMGHTHSLINDGDTTLEFLGIVPQHNLKEKE